MNNLKSASEISMDGDCIKYQQGTVSQNQHEPVSQNQKENRNFLSSSNVSDSCLYYATNTKTQALRVSKERMDEMPPSAANSQVPLSLRNIDRTAEQILFNAGCDVYADRVKRPLTNSGSFGSPSEPPPGFGSNAERIRPSSPFDISSGISFTDMLRRPSANSFSFISPNPLDSPGFERSISYADSVRRLPASGCCDRSSPFDFITGRLQAISASNDSNRSSPADFNRSISYADKVKSPSANSVSNRSSPTDYGKSVSNRDSPSDYMSYISSLTDNSHRLSYGSSLTDDSGRFSFGSFNSSTRGSPLWQQELAWQQEQVWKQEAAVDANEVNKALLSAIHKLTIDTESTATLVNEDHAFIHDNLEHVTVTEPFLLQQVTTDNCLVNADTDPKDNCNATAYCEVDNEEIRDSSDYYRENDIATASTNNHNEVNDLTNDNTTNHCEDKQHLANDRSTLVLNNHYMDDNESTTDSEDEIYYSDEEEFFQDNNNLVANNTDLNNHNNHVEEAFMKNHVTASSPRTSCSESVESYYYSAENNDTIDVEFDQALVDHDNETEVNIGDVNVTGDLVSVVKEEVEEWETVDRQRRKRRESITPVRENPLKQEYCFWYWKRGPGSKDYGAHCNLICTFETVEEFWAAYSHLTRPDEMRNGLDMHVFKKGIKPVWEDEANRGGGKWMVRLPKHKISLCWENLLLAVLGDQFLAASQYICGVVVSARFRENFIALWIKQTGDPAINNYICDKFKKVLKMSRYESNVFEYKAHQDSLKDDRSFQNTDIFIR